MFIPNKYEDLNNSSIVLGADIIKILKKESYNIEDLYQKIKKGLNKNVSLNQYYNTLTFLWITEIVELNEITIRLKK